MTFCERCMQNIKLDSEGCDCGPGRLWFNVCFFLEFCSPKKWSSTFLRSSRKYTKLRKKVTKNPCSTRRRDSRSSWRGTKIGPELPDFFHCICSLYVHLVVRKKQTFLRKNRFDSICFLAKSLVWSINFFQTLAVNNILSEKNWIYSRYIHD